MTTEVRQLDSSELKQRVRRMYEEVALQPEHEFHFETGHLEVIGGPDEGSGGRPLQADQQRPIPERLP